MISELLKFQFDYEDTNMKYKLLSEIISFSLKLVNINHSGKNGEQEMVEI